MTSVILVIIVGLVLGIISVVAILWIASKVDSFIKTIIQRHKPKDRTQEEIKLIELSRKYQKTYDDSNKPDALREARFNEGACTCKEFDYPDNHGNINKMRPYNRDCPQHGHFVIEQEQRKTVRHSDGGHA